MSTDATAGRGDPMPMLTIRHGAPSDDELAALTAVLVATTRPPDRAQPSVDSGLVGGWKSYWRTVRAPFHAGREAWRHSYR